MKRLLDEKRDRLVEYIEYLKEINMKIAELEYSMYCVRGVLMKVPLSGPPTVSW